MERARPFRLLVVSPETCGLGTPNQHCCLAGRTRCDDATPRKGREAQRPPAEHQLTPSSAAQRLPPSSKTHYEPRAARTGQAKRSPHRLQGAVTSTITRTSSGTRWGLHPGRARQLQVRLAPARCARPREVAWRVSVQTRCGRYRECREPTSIVTASIASSPRVAAPFREVASC